MKPVVFGKYRRINLLVIFWKKTTASFFTVHEDRGRLSPETLLQATRLHSVTSVTFMKFLNFKLRRVHLGQAT